MSAYAVSFGSYLPPVTSSPAKDDTHNTSQCSNRIDNESIVSYNKPLAAVHVEVKSAMIDAGVLVRPNRRNKNSAKQPTSYFSLPDDAVIFKLSIDFNGRKYNASRSFESFVKFRRDLMKELRSSQKESVLPTLPECISDQPNIHMGWPKISAINNMALAAASNRLSGFTKLQSLLLCYYCPLIQCWLKQIVNTTDVDTSSSLNNFLWEPLRPDDDDSVPSIMSSLTISSSSTSSHKGSIGSAMSLSSIHEDYGFDDSDTDCDE